jgi:cellulose synthase/poly-beta-1,6-N-acetylglucosamine synthase-like glycosyltransferase
MAMVVDTFMWALVFAMMLYFTLMLIISWGWFRLKSFSTPTDSIQIPLSIVIAVRNEENNIEPLLKDLAGQNYPKELFEIIIVDDHSEDKTSEIINRFVNDNPAQKIIQLHTAGDGKKAALAEGISTATGEIIVTTDGDCRMKPDWLRTIAAYFATHKPALLIAPVVYHNEKGILQHMFSLDFISLVAAGAGGAGAGLPLMGNGANLAFTKKAWQKANSGKKEAFVSGDDVFLIHRIERLFGSKAIYFLKSVSAIVRTNPPTDLRIFFQQRIRWASKAKGYRSPWAIFVAVVVLAVNLLTALTFFAGIFNPWFFVIYGLFIILKMLIDLPLIIEFTGFANKRKLLLLLFPLALIYPVYIVFAAFAALFFRFEWKGRGGLK